MMITIIEEGIFDEFLHDWTCWLVYVMAVGENWLMCGM